LYPHRVCYPLAFERSGYLHPAFDDFVDLYSRCSTLAQPQSQTSLQLRFAFAFAITFTTATLLRAASLRLLPPARSSLIFHPNLSLFPHAGPRCCPRPRFPILSLRLLYLALTLLQ
jgi:hypothetical protein